MQHAHQTNLAANEAGIARELLRGCGWSAEEQVVKQPRVLAGEWSELRR